MEFSYLSCWISVILCFGYFYIRYKYSYWHRHKIPFIQPKFPFGNLKLVAKDEHISEKLTKFYEQRNIDIPIVGLYFFLSPVVFATDLDLIRCILIKDFQYFQDRATIYDKKTTPLSANLFNLEYDEWKPLRKKITPTFTSLKMKCMFPTIIAVADEFIDRMNAAIRTDTEVNVTEWLARYSTDVIGNCAFGVDCNCLKDPNAKFREMGKRIFNKPKISIIQRLFLMPLRNFVKPLLKLLGISLHHEDVTDFFLNVVKETVNYRENNNVQRNDFMDLLIKMKNSTNESERLTVNEIAAQCFLFFLAGFETSSTVLVYCLYELATDNQKHIQNAARAEIQTVLKKNNGNLCYESLSEMTYISQIINETLRKHPPASFITRTTTNSYHVPNTNYTMPTGMRVFISVYDIHHHPDIYENPKEFDPNRFSAEVTNTRPSCTFIPFGDGNRNCLGYRFGVLQIKIALVKLLHNFEFSVSSNTSIPIKYNPTRLLLAPTDAIWLNVRKIS